MILHIDIHGYIRGTLSVVWPKSISTQPWKMNAVRCKRRVTNYNFCHNLCRYSSRRNIVICESSFYTRHFNRIMR